MKHVPVVDLGDIRAARQCRASAARLGYTTRKPLAQTSPEELRRDTRRMLQMIKIEVDTALANDCVADEALGNILAIIQG